jgi:hypothetical protein
MLRPSPNEKADVVPVGDEECRWGDGSELKIMSLDGWEKGSKCTLMASDFFGNLMISVCPGPNDIWKTVLHFVNEWGVIHAGTKPLIWFINASWVSRELGSLEVHIGGL